MNQPQTPLYAGSNFQTSPLISEMESRRKIEQPKTDALTDSSDEQVIEVEKTPEAPKPKLTIEELHSAWQKTPDDPTATYELVNAFNNDIEQAIRRYGSTPSTINRTRGQQIVLDAIRSYDPNSGTQLRSWVNTQLNRLRRILTESAANIKTSEENRRRMYEINQARKELEYKLNRPPTTAEIAEATGLTEQQVVRATQLSKSVASSHFEDSSDIRVFADDNQETWIEDMVYVGLDDKNKYIMDHLFGYQGQQIQTLAEVAKALGMTPAAVSYRVKQIREQLQEAEALEQELI